MTKTSKEIKKATPSYDVHELITKRWSARSFSNRPIDQETLEKLFESASWAASSMNEQPWKYIYAHRNTSGFDRLHDCLMDGNQPWAKHGAVLLLALAKKKFDRNGKENRHAMHDVGAANTTLLLQAAHDDIYGHMMGGFHMDKTIETLGIDTEVWEPACFIALGYLDEAEALPEPFKTRELTPRERKSVSSFTESIT